MGPIWGRQDPGGPHVGPMNFAIWERTITSPVTIDMYNKDEAISNINCHAIIT